MGTNIFARLRTGVATTSAEALQALAAELAAALPPDTTLALHGDLGVGKTTWVQGLARGLGVTTRVTSPTFNLFCVYPIPPGRSACHRLLHLDAYRLDQATQIEALMLEDFLLSPWCLAIEWPEKIAPWVPADALHFDLAITDHETHTVRLRS